MAVAESGDLNYENTTVAAWRERQKSNRFNEQNNKSARASRFFVHFCYRSCLNTTDRKWPNFKFTWEQERQADKFYHLWDNREEKVKGCEVYFSGMFSWTSLLYSVAVGIEES